MQGILFSWTGQKQITVIVSQFLPCSMFSLNYWNICFSYLTNRFTWLVISKEANYSWSNFLIVSHTSGRKRVGITIPQCYKMLLKFMLKFMLFPIKKPTSILIHIMVIYFSTAHTWATCLFVPWLFCLLFFAPIALLNPMTSLWTYCLQRKQYQL